MKRKKTEKLTVRTSPVDMRLLARIADEKQMTKSGVVRGLIYQEAAACGVLPEAKDDAPDGRPGHRRRRYDR